MSETQQAHPLDDKVLVLNLTVKQINTILYYLGEMPFVQVAPSINAIQTQCRPQVDALMANQEKKDG
jgi:hypothetical protein